MFEKNFGHAPRLPAGRGKIARLPGDIREQLNQRLLDGQSASAIHSCLRVWWILVLSGKVAKST